jgi:hypothetical protein
LPTTFYSNVATAKKISPSLLVLVLALVLVLVLVLALVLVLVLVLERLHCISAFGSGVFAVQSIPATGHSGAPTSPIAIRSFDRRPAHTPYASRPLPSEFRAREKPEADRRLVLVCSRMGESCRGMARMAGTAMPREDRFAHPLGLRV